MYDKQVTRKPNSELAPMMAAMDMMSRRLAKSEWMAWLAMAMMGTALVMYAMSIAMFVNMMGM